jgi:hypothetical protein
VLDLDQRVVGADGLPKHAGGRRPRTSREEGEAACEKAIPAALGLPLVEWVASPDIGEAPNQLPLTIGTDESDLAALALNHAGC